MLILLVLLPACAPVDGKLEDSADSFACGPGTREEDGQCVVDDADTDTDTDSDTDTDTDSDTDTDTDTDSDTDTDTDTDVAPDYTVCADGVAPYDDLQDAIDAANDGDVIYVCAGTYDRVEIDQLEVTLVGDGADSTVIDGGRRTALYVTDSSIVMSGFGLTGGADGASEETLAGALYFIYSTFEGADLRVFGCEGDGGGYGVVQKESTSSWDDVVFEGNSVSSAFIAVTGGEVTMRNAVFTGNGPLPANGYGGQALYLEADRYEVSNILVYANEAGFDTDVVDLRGADEGWLYNAVVHGNVGGGEALSASGGTTVIENCIVSENTGANGVATSNGAVVRFTDSYGNEANFSPEASSQPDNFSSNPRFTDPDAGDFHLDPGFSPAIDQGNPLAGYNDADGTRNDLGAFGGPYGGWSP